MPVNLSNLLDPKHSALLIMECQEGIIGPAAGRLGALSEAVARHDTVAQIAQLITAARAVGSPIFYLNAARRADSGGAATNCLLLALGRKGTPLVPGSPQQAVVQPLAPQDGDYVLNRFHGVTPFHATGFDQILRNLGVQTVVVCGVSVNVGITGMIIEAVNCGYQVVLPRDGVTGTPDEYVDAVIHNSLRLLATVTTVADVRSAWKAPA